MPRVYSGRVKLTCSPEEPMKKMTLALCACLLPLLAACGSPDSERNNAAKSGPTKVETVLASIRTDADEGDATAQYELGSDYRNGWGVPQDWEQAYFWLSLAASANQRVSENAYIGKNAASFHLTPGQRAAADARIAAWKPKLAPAHGDANAKQPAAAK
jgi:TPR repeat protein